MERKKNWAEKEVRLQCSFNEYVSRPSGDFWRWTDLSTLFQLAEMARLLYPFISQSLDVAVPGRRCVLVEAAVLNWDNLEEADNWQPAACSTPAAGDIRSSVLRRIQEAHLLLHQSEQTEKAFSGSSIHSENICCIIVMGMALICDDWFLQCLQVHNTSVLCSLPLPNSLGGSAVARTHLPILHIEKLTAEKTNQPGSFTSKPSSI